LLTARWRAEIKRLGIHAQTAVRCPLDERFCIHSTEEMVMQVTSLRHCMEKKQQLVIVLADALKIALGSYFM
jgi:hypothetical protein